MRVTIVTDGSFCPHNKVGGYAYWIVSDRGRNGHSYGLETAPNINYCEQYAINAALERGKRICLILPGDDVIFYTDSLTAIKLYRDGEGSKNLESEGQLKKFRILTKNLTFDFKHLRPKLKSNETPLIAAIKFCDRNAHKELNRMREKIGIIPERRSNNSLKGC